MLKSCILLGQNLIKQMSREDLSREYSKKGFLCRFITFYVSMNVNSQNKIWTWNKHWTLLRNVDMKVMAGTERFSFRLMDTLKTASSDWQNKVSKQSSKRFVVLWQFSSFCHKLTSLSVFTDTKLCSHKVHIFVSRGSPAVELGLDAVRREDRHHRGHGGHGQQAQHLGSIDQSEASTGRDWPIRGLAPCIRFRAWVQ